MESYYALTIYLSDEQDYEALIKTLEGLGAVDTIEQYDDHVFINGSFNTLNLGTLESFFYDYKFELSITG